MAKKLRKPGKIALRDALTMVSPGTQLREAIAAIIQSENGALLCIGDAKRLADLSEGGVEIDTEYTPQLLYELAKMDGAIILNADASKIMYANRFIKVDSSIPTDETGTRHRAAERLAKQAGCIVVAVSERRSSVTLYVQDVKHVLDSISTLLNKSMQALNTLEKYVRALDQATTDLSTREFEDVVTIFDVCKAVQRCEMGTRIAEEIEPYILELGIEGRLVEMQLKELVIPFEEAQLVAKDYFREKAGVRYEHILERIDEITSQELLELPHISNALGYGTNMKSIDTYLSPRGYRILTQTRRLTPQIIENLVQKFGSLQQIMRAPKEELCMVDGIGEVLAERIRLSLNTLRNQLAMDRGRR
ncbi:MAG TPA: DNA integrity scanning diadenylate cyclase DisA [Candidatus Hydrogenedentes bacterium]|nr:DNA integrity scanning diadenylate cyclase DisA [Candidatus Hydrogenedentota bacterium]